MGAEGQGASAIEQRWLMTARSLSFIRCGDELLLLKRGAHKRVFPNQYNGLGGFIERNEDPLSSAKREILEESDLVVDNLRLVAIHHIDASAQTGILLFVFVGELGQKQALPETPEGVLEWVKVTDLSHYDLVEDLPLILPRYLEHQSAPLFAHVSYDANDQIQIRYARG